MAKVGKNDDPRSEVRKQARSPLIKRSASPEPSPVKALAFRPVDGAFLDWQARNEFAMKRKNRLRVIGPLHPPRTKGRSKRGWTTPA